LFSSLDNGNKVWYCHAMSQRYGSWTILREYRDEKNLVRFDMRCDCGALGSNLKVAVVGGRSLTCRSCARKKSKPAALGVEPTAKYVYTDYKHKAMERGLAFDLTFSQFFNISQRPCYYCNREPSNVLKSKRDGQLDFTYSGVDRIVNSKGYHEDNVVPCCKECNYAKRNMGINEFYQWACKIMMNVHKIADLAEMYDEEFEPFVIWMPEYFEQGEDNDQSICTTL
jgi:hypothetical protein